MHLKIKDREVMPNLNKLARNGVQFTSAYAQSTHSDYSDVTIVSSLYPLRSPRHHYYSAHDPWAKTLVYDLLKPAGGDGNLSSQNEKWGGMDQFLTSPNLDLYYDAERSTAPTRLDQARHPASRARDESGRCAAARSTIGTPPTWPIAWVNEQAKPSGVLLEHELPKLAFSRTMHRTQPASAPRSSRASSISNRSFLEHPD